MKLKNSFNTLILLLFPLVMLSQNSLRINCNATQVTVVKQNLYESTPEVTMRDCNISFISQNNFLIMYDQARSLYTFEKLVREENSMGARTMEWKAKDENNRSCKIILFRPSNYSGIILSIFYPNISYTYSTDCIIE